MRYKATAPARDKEGNLVYSEKTLGVRFEKGIAFFDELTIDKSLGLTPEQIATRMRNDFGYKVEEIKEGQSN